MTNGRFGEEWVPDTKKCPKCKGTGIMTDKDGNERHCPYCKPTDFHIIPDAPDEDICWHHPEKQYLHYLKSQCIWCQSEESDDE